MVKVQHGELLLMQPYKSLGLPDPDECIGIAGLTMSVIVAITALAWLMFYQGGLVSFGVIVLAALVGWVSFMYCETWEGQFGFDKRWGEA